MNNTRHSRGKSKSKRESHEVSTTGLILDAGKYYSCYQIEDRSKSDGRLLRHNKPFKESERIVRETSKSKRLIPEPR